jgi:hypothetical protein
MYISKKDKIYTIELIILKKEKKKKKRGIG